MAEPQETPPLRTEIIAGVTTFFTMAYIVVVNPTILSTPGTGIPFSGALTATVLVCSVMTLLMGLYAKLPFGVAPGMGLNAFFTFTIVLQGGVPWPVALGIVFWAGVLFLLISTTPLRETIAIAIPPSLRMATSAGIGLLLTFIGLRNAGFIADNPATLVGVGPLDHRTVLTLVALAVIVWRARQPSTLRSLAFLASIFVVTAAAWIGGWVAPPATWFSAPDFSSVFFKLDVLGALRLTLLPAIITVMMTDLFDSLSTFIGVAQASKMLDADGRPRNLRKGLIVDSFATFGAGLFGSSPGTAYVESIAGIRAGGRTGRTAIVTGLCFLPCLFIAPLAAAVPPYATAAVLIMVGVAMFQTVTGVEFDRLEIGVPAFATLILIPLTFSITQGILWGFILHVALHVVAGKSRDLNRTVWALAAVSVALLVLEHAKVTMESPLLDVARDELQKIKKLADKAIAQLDEAQLWVKLDPEANSVAVLMRHMAGNMRSRWTDFLTSDGEKPDRQRDQEFEDVALDRAALQAEWDDGWQRVFDALAPLTDADLHKTVFIREEPHSVNRAIIRQITHYAGHTYQILMLAKHFKGAEWKTPSIPRGQSEEFNRRLLAKARTQEA